MERNKVLGLIPARSGSKGIPRKNILDIAGSPLIVWTIKAAKNSRYIDSLILSSDDDEIIAIARENGVDVPFKRPIELALDDTPGIDVVLHAIEQCPGYDIVVLLQPTSPLRKTEDIDEAIHYMLDNNAPACVSLVEPEKSPFWMFELNYKNKLINIFSKRKIVPNRQELPKVYALNGAVYVAWTDWLESQKSFITKETVGYVMPRNRSIDVDDEVDLLVAETLLKQAGF